MSSRRTSPCGVRTTRSSPGFPPVCRHAMQGRGGTGIINGLLQPDEVQTVTIETPWKAGMLSNNYNFSHVNGTIKPNRVKAIEGADTKDSGKKK